MFIKKHFCLIKNYFFSHIQYLVKNIFLFMKSIPLFMKQIFMFDKIIISQECGIVGTCFQTVLIELPYNTIPKFKIIFF